MIKHFPKKLHNKFKEYPPALEIMTPADDWMSDYQLDLKDKLNINIITHLYIVIR